jgi:ribosomal protein S18 acetylase RimI-like enzyme
LPEDETNLAAFGSWRLRQQGLLGTVAGQPVDISWFGVDTQYQGARYDETTSLARALYNRIETEALSETTETGPPPFLVLDCHEENVNGRGFWESCGYVVRENDVSLDGRGTPPHYLRMTR